MNKAVIITNAFLILISLSFSSYAGRTTGSVQGTPTVYSVNPQVMQLCNTYSTITGECSGDMFTFTKTYTDNDGFCDIAAVEPGQPACDFGPTSGMTPGHVYNYIRLVMKRDMKLRGTVAITGANAGNANITHCSTSSSNTNSDDIVAAGVAGQSPTTQTLTMLTAPGNETFQGNASIGTANTTNQESEDMGRAYFAGFAGTSLAKDGGSPYYFTWSYATPSNGQLWLGDANEAGDNITMIYALSSAYTAEKAKYPVFTMTIDVTDSLYCGVVDGTNDGSGAEADEVCYCENGSPSISYTITD